MQPEMTNVIHQTVPILEKMGIEVVESTRGRAEIVLPFEPNRNHVGTTYAGSLFSAAEVLGGLLALSSWQMEGYAPIVRSMSIDFLRPALGDVRASAQMSMADIERIAAEAIVEGKANYDLVATVVDAQGVVVAQTTGHYQLRKFS